MIEENKIPHVFNVNSFDSEHDLTGSARVLLEGSLLFEFRSSTTQVRVVVPILKRLMANTHIKNSTYWKRALLQNNYVIPWIFEQEVAMEVSPIHDDTWIHCGKSFYLGLKLKKIVLPNGTVAWGMNSSKYVQAAV
jgi:hypothetical protein